MNVSFVADGDSPAKTDKPSSELSPSPLRLSQLLTQYQHSSFPSEFASHMNFPSLNWNPQSAMPAATDTSTTRSEATKAAQGYLNQRLASGAGVTSSTQFTVPTIDIGQSFSSNIENRKACAAQIRDACQTSGFFQIIGHGVSNEARQGILHAAKRFTKDLPREQKEVLHVKHSKYFRGWEPAEFTNVNPADWTAEDAAPETKEGFNWGYEEGLDPTGGDGLYRELDGSLENGNVWPSEQDLPGFYAAVATYYSEVLQLARHLFRLFALSLSLPETYFDSMTTHPGGIARLLYYPPQKDLQILDPAHAQKDNTVGLGAHSDYECLTILLCSTVSGLEILSPENVWVPAPAVEGSLTINVADFLMRWTNGLYRSTVHRVVNRTKEERYSVPFFFSINYEEEVEVSQIVKHLCHSYHSCMSLIVARRFRAAAPRRTHPSTRGFELASTFWRDYKRPPRTNEEMNRSRRRPSRRNQILVQDFALLVIIVERSFVFNGLPDLVDPFHRIVAQGSRVDRL